MSGDCSVAWLLMDGNGSWARTLRESLPRGSTVTFSEALGAVREDVVEERQGPCEAGSWPL